MKNTLKHFTVFMASLILMTSCGGYTLLITSETKKEDKNKIINNHISIDDGVKVKSQGVENIGSVNGYNDFLMVVAGELEEPIIIAIDDIDTLYARKTQYQVILSINDQRNSVGSPKNVKGYLTEVTDSSLLIVKKKHKEEISSSYHINQVQKIRIQRKGTFVRGFFVGFIPWTLAAFTVVEPTGMSVVSRGDIILGHMGAGILTGLFTGTMAKTLIYNEKFIINGDYNTYLQIKPDLEKYIRIQ